MAAQGRYGFRENALVLRIDNDQPTHHANDPMKVSSASDPRPKEFVVYYFRAYRKAGREELPRSAEARSARRRSPQCSVYSDPTTVPLIATLQKRQLTGWPLTMPAGPQDGALWPLAGNGAHHTPHPASHRYRLPPPALEL
jgi:hypothetical protein